MTTATRTDNQPESDQATQSGVSDRLLMERYVRHGDPAALEAIVLKYQGLVHSVCQRQTRFPEDADEAFQVVFLVLVRSAKRIRKADSLASWLYGVAYRTCVRINRQRQNSIMTLSEEPIQTEPGPLEKLARRFALQTTDDELNRLPNSLKAPLVLRYLQGLSNQEVADEMKLSVAAVEGRLKRAKSILRSRLGKLGISTAGALAAVSVSTRESSATATTATSNVESAARTLSQLRGNQASSVSQIVTELVEIEVQSMLRITLAKVISYGLLCVAVTGVGSLVYSDLSWAGYGASATSANAQDSLQIASTASTVASEESAGVIQLVQADSPFDTEAASDAESNEDPFPGSNTEPEDESFAGFEGESEENDSAFDDSETSSAASEATPFDEPNSENTGVDADPFAANVKLTAVAGNAEQRILDELEKPTNFPFVDLTLAEVVAYLERLHEIEIFLDKRELEAIGVTSDTPVTCELDGIRLKSALQLMLSELDLGYEVRHDVLVITSKEKARPPFSGNQLSIFTRSEIEDQILKRMNAETDLQLEGVPLSELVGILRERLDCNVVLDEPALDELGLSTDQEVSCQLKRIPLRSALKTILKPLDLALSVTDDVLTITSQDYANQNAVTRLYRVDINWPFADLNHLIGMLTATVEPDSWDELGGEGSMQPVNNGLMVSNTCEVHDQIEEVLQQIQTFIRQNPEASAGLDRDRFQVPVSPGNSLRNPPAQAPGNAAANQHVPAATGGGEATGGLGGGGFF
ncbi:MAG: sigma-70 family RNA polymerase sigma factor [Pirellulaceae bacterium]